MHKIFYSLLLAGAVALLGLPSLEAQAHHRSGHNGGPPQQRSQQGSQQGARQRPRPPADEIEQPEEHSEPSRRDRERDRQSEDRHREDRHREDRHREDHEEGNSLRLSTSQIERLRDLLGDDDDEEWISEELRREIRAQQQYSLPPGIQRRLARGRGLPPGIAKKVLPGRVNGHIGINDDVQIIVIGPDAVVVDPVTDLIIDIVRDILR